MKKLILILLCVILVLPVHAASTSVVDNAGLLSDSEIASLEAKISALTDTYPMDIAIVTVNSLEGKTAQMFADDYYDYNGYGYGSDHSGILLLLDMNSRSWAVTTDGNTETIIPNTKIDAIMDDCLEMISKEQYSEGFTAFLNGVSQAYAEDEAKNNEEPDMRTMLIAKEKR